ncbi:MAG: acetolactate synthase small subunit [Acidimicrobiales bacterium]
MRVSKLPHHLFSIKVENKARVLVRVAGLFARRGFNIVSLAVAPTDDERYSRLAIVVDGDTATLEQIRAQLDKLVNVVEITEIKHGTAHEVELALVCVKKDAHGALANVLANYRAEILEDHDDLVLAEVVAHPEDLDALTDSLVPFGIVDFQRTGRIAIVPPS